MSNVNLLNSIVPISALSKSGGVSKVIESLNDGPKMIVKNNQPVAVLLSPSEYTRLTEAAEAKNN